jgi:putative addiction module component (TIGR02574 family)
MKANDLLTIAESLPIDIKIQLIDKLLNSLNPFQKEIDKLWVKEAEKRVEEIRINKVKTIPGEDVFKEIQKRFSK